MGGMGQSQGSEHGAKPRHTSQSEAQLFRKHIPPWESTRGAMTNYYLCRVGPNVQPAEHLVKGTPGDSVIGTSSSGRPTWWIGACCPDKKDKVKTGGTVYMEDH